MRNYTIAVYITNDIGTKISSKEIKVEVKKCTAPPVLFQYGTADEPIIFTRGDAKKFIATWPKICENDQFTFKQWMLNGTGTSTVDKNGYDAASKQAVYKINKLSYPAGTYQLTLAMMFISEEIRYHAFMIIEESALVAQILNGGSQSIAYKRKIAVVSNSTANSTTYNFTLDGTLSYDPDQPTKNLALMSFEWRCLLLTDNEVIVNKSRNTRNSVNTTYDEICQQRTMTLLDLSLYQSTHGKIMFNTEMLLENVTYQFSLTVTKGSRKGTVVQNVFIALGAPPNVEVK